MSDNRVKETDYLGYPVHQHNTSNNANTRQLQPQPHLEGYDRNYLGADHQAGHLRDQSIDVSDNEAYDLGNMSKATSMSPLHPAAGTHDGYTHQNQGSAKPNQGLNTPYTGRSTPNRVHYPPSPQIARGDAYTTVPLQDRDASPLGSGANTPNGSQNKKKHWSFLPGNASSTSLGTHSKNGNGSYDEKTKRPKGARGASWDLLGERGEWEEYNPKNASVENLRFAEGDAGTNKFSRLYYWALNRGIVVRWFLYIIPILALLWIPGIVWLAGKRDAQIWHVDLLWWSVWLSIVWCGFWAATAVFMVVPTVFRNTIGSVIPTARAYTDVVAALGRYAKLIIWSVANWVSFTPIIINHFEGDQSSTSRSNLTIIASLLFGIFLSSLILAVEKLVVQLIAFQFHRDSYEDRLRDQKFNMKCLALMYTNSHDIPGRSDTLTDAATTRTKASQMPKIAIRRALRGLRDVAQTTTTVLGNVATEMTGQSVLQTNSPVNKVTAALNSANKSKALARRLYYSFRAPGADHLDISDIASFFPDLETAHAAFEMFDKDGNGDATRDEIESAILGMHRERLSLEASMRDLDGAVRRLDDIFMVLVIAIVVLIMAAMVTTKLTTLVTSAGTFILSLSWLIGSTMLEILSACLFLFVKHPYDVGDRVDIDSVTYTVAKMQLMSSSFKRADGTYVWIGHNVLSTKIISNIRRSGPIAESFAFDVAFDTSFEALQALRARMLKFCSDNSRDFLPIFDVIVDDFSGQGKLTLKADIKYKSNWQQGALKVQRRNKWICALKMTLADLKIFGPAGAGNPEPDPAEPAQYTMVPWEEVKPQAKQPSKPESPPPTFATATALPALTSNREVINDSSQDIWDEQDELMNGPTAAPSRAGTPGLHPSLNQNQGMMGPNARVASDRSVPQIPQHADDLEMSSVQISRRQ